MGPIARSVADAAAILAAIAGPDDRDPTTLSDPLADHAAPAGGMGGLRLGFDPQWNSVDVDPAVQRVLAEAEQVFRALGASIIPVDVPDVAQAVIDWVPNAEA